MMILMKLTMFEYIPPLIDMAVVVVVVVAQVGGVHLLQQLLPICMIAFSGEHGLHSQHHSI